jgi:hypothetical protein
VLAVLSLTLSFIGSQKVVGNVSVQSQLVTKLLIKTGYKADAISLDLQLKFRPSQNDFNFGNILQTTSGRNGIRYELQPSGLLYLVSAESSVIPICKLSTDNEYTLTVVYQKSGLIHTAINSGMNQLCTKALFADRLAVDRFVIGSGMSEARSFGTHINLEKLFLSTSYTSYFSLSLSLVNGLILALILHLVLLGVQNNNYGDKILFLEFSVIIFSYIIVGLILRKFFHGYISQIKWIGYLIPCGFFIYLFFKDSLIKVKFRERIMFWFLMVSDVLYLLFIFGKEQKSYEMLTVLLPIFIVIGYKVGRILGVLLMSIILIAASQLTNLDNLATQLDQNIYLPLILMFLIVLLYTNLIPKNARKN